MKIQVTKEDIENALKELSENPYADISRCCPITQAVKRLNFDKNVSVGLIANLKKYILWIASERIELPQKAQKFATEFDSAIGLKNKPYLNTFTPIEFEIDFRS